MDKLRASGGSYMIDVLFTLALLCVLAASALMVVLIGANIYKETVWRMDQNFSTSTSLMYVSTKIRQNDASGDVFLSKVDSLPALVLENTYNGIVYQTWIYHDNGALYEIPLVQKGTAVRRGDGHSVVEVGRFYISEEAGGLFRFTSQNKDGNSVSLLISLRSET